MALLRVLVKINFPFTSVCTRSRIPSKKVADESQNDDIAMGIVPVRSVLPPVLHLQPALV